MNRTKSLDQLELAFQTGAGVAILCEGEDGGFDQRIYKEWFDAMGRLTFHAQDGWERVHEALTALRHRGSVQAYGLIDRDWASEAEIAAQFEPAYADFVYRLSRYDLESYLLEPELWLRVLKRVLWRGEPNLPPGWDSTLAVHNQILGLYRQAFPVAAHNWAIHCLNVAKGSDWNLKSKKYFKSIDALQKVDPEDALTRHYGPFGAAEEACTRYRERLQFLQQHADRVDILCTYVSGKVVLDALFHAIPRAPARPNVDFRTLVERYMEPYLDGQSPPDDVKALIDCILSRAERDRSP